jgi:signal transduction histidine kinase
MTRGGPPSAQWSEESLADRRSWPAALSGWMRAELRTVRDDWAGTSRWAQARRLVVPAVLAWTMAGGAGVHTWRVVVVVLVVFALLARFTLPAAALLSVVASVTVLPAAAGAVPVVAYGAARRIAAPRRAGAVFALASVVLALSVAVRGSALPWVTVAALAGAVVGIGLILPGAVGALAGERARRVEALRERNTILERAHRLGDEQARMQERARIAGEMHDLLGHRLSLISLYAGALEMGTRQGAPALNEQATLVQTTARTALDELRGVLGILKVDAPPLDTDGHSDDAGTRADVSALVLASQRAGMPVELRWDGDDLRGLDGRIRRAVHRVVREALTNVHKHAPGATTSVAVQRDAEWIRVEVRNDLPDHHGRPAPGTGMGLVGLQERVRLAGGTIRAGAGIDCTHFVVTALLPLVPAPGDTDSGDMTIDHADLVDRQTSDTPSAAETGSHIGSSARGSTATMSKPAKIVLYVLLGVVVVCCGGGLIGTKILSTKVKEASISPETFHAAQLGQPEDQVRKAVGEKGSIARDALVGAEPPIPTGARCAYALSGRTINDTSRLVYRFCFAGGKLVEKREIQGPGADPAGK